MSMQAPVVGGPTAISVVLPVECGGGRTKVAIRSRLEFGLMSVAHVSVIA